MIYKMKKSISLLIIICIASFAFMFAGCAGEGNFDDFDSLMEAVETSLNETRLKMSLTADVTSFGRIIDMEVSMDSYQRISQSSMTIDGIQMVIYHMDGITYGRATSMPMPGGQPLLQRRDDFFNENQTGLNFDALGSNPRFRQLSPSGYNHRYQLRFSNVDFGAATGQNVGRGNLNIVIYLNAETNELYKMEYGFTVRIERQRHTFNFVFRVLAVGDAVTIEIPESVQTAIANFRQ